MCKSPMDVSTFFLTSEMYGVCGISTSFLEVEHWTINKIKCERTSKYIQKD